MNMIMYESHIQARLHWRHAWMTTGCRYIVSMDHFDAGLGACETVIGFLALCRL